VLIDQRGPRAAVAHPRHQLPGAGSGSQGERVAGVPQVLPPVAPVEWPPRSSERLAAD
jgi:hypothetical protein